MFTDTRYSIDALTLCNKSFKNSRIVNKIIDELSTPGSPILILHWVPSHVSFQRNNMSYLIDGKEIADKSALTAAKSDKNYIDVHSEFIDIPKQIINITAELTAKIDKFAYTVNESQDSEPVGPSSDDFSFTDASQFTSMECSVTSSDV